MTSPKRKPATPPNTGMNFEKNFIPLLTPQLMSFKSPSAITVKSFVTTSLTKLFTLRKEAAIDEKNNM